MKSFQEYVAGRTESTNEMAFAPQAKPMDYRVPRPGQYNPVLDSGKMLQQLQNPQNLKMVIKVLDEHPEMKQKLWDMIKDAKDMEDFGYVRMPGQ